MSDGAIKGFNLGRTLCAAYNVTQGAPAPAGAAARHGLRSASRARPSSRPARRTSNDLLARTSFMDMNGAGSLQPRRAGARLRARREAHGPDRHRELRRRWISSSATSCRSTFAAPSRRPRSRRTSASSSSGSFATRSRSGWKTESRIGCATSCAEGCGASERGLCRHTPRFAELPLAAVRGVHEHATRAAQHELELLGRVERSARRGAPLRPRRRAPLDREHALARQRIVGERDGLAVERGRHDARELRAALRRRRSDDGRLLLRRQRAARGRREQRPPRAASGASALMRPRASGS